MKPKIRGALPAMITAIIGGILLTIMITRGHALPMQYFTLGAVILMMLFSVLLGMSGLRAFRLSYNQPRGRFFVLDSETPSLNWFAPSFGVLLACFSIYITSGRHLPIPEFIATQASIFIIIDLGVISYCTESILRAINAEYDFDSLHPTLDGENCRNKRNIRDIFIDYRKKGAAYMPFFSYLLSTLCLVWLLSRPDILGQLSFRYLLWGAHVLSSVMIISSQNNTYLHHKALLHIIKEGRLSAETTAAVDVYRVFAILAKRSAFGVALVFYPATFYFMYVLIFEL